MSRSSAELPCAVVVGDGLNGLGVLRSLWRARVPVVLLGTDGNHPAMRSRHGSKVLYRDSHEAAVIEALERVARGLRGQRPPLILTQEHTVSAVSAHRDRLKNRYRLTLPTHDALLPLMHKDGFRAVAKAAGARIPRATRIRCAADLESLAALNAPLVVKPAVRDEQYARLFRKAYRVESIADAVELLQTMLPVFADLVVQEWIEGNDSDLYFCLQYLPSGAEQPVSFVGRKIRSWPPLVGGTASCVAAPEADELIDTTTTFFRKAGITGLAGMEYKKNARSGEYVMVEPTIGRTDHQEEVATLNGVNVPLAAYRDVLDQPLPSTRAVSPPRVWRDRQADRQSAVANPSGETRMPGGARIVDALWRASDPMPGVGLLTKKVHCRLQRVIRGTRMRFKQGGAP